jgi:drug/metabolite transporter (DMT)-like permease
VFVALALASAVFYGAADFIGGLTSRKVHTVAVGFISQFAGLILLLMVLPLLPPSSPQPADFLWGGAAGLTGGTGVALLYRALSIGTMAIVAPTTAVCAVIIPVLVSVALGERLALVAIGGIVLAIAAIFLVSRSSDRSDRSGRSDRAGMGLAFLSGVAIGLFYLSIARASPEAGLWPLLAARLVSAPLFGVLAFALGVSVRMPLGVGAAAVFGGALDMLANLLYLIATWYGPLSLAVTLSALYPASTVLLARLTLGEQLSTMQSVGVVCALAAVILIVGNT